MPKFCSVALGMMEEFKETHGSMKTTQLEVGDMMLMADGKKQAITAITGTEAGTTHTVYNPVLDGDHTYYANGMLVHNPANKN